MKLINLMEDTNPQARRSAGASNQELVIADLQNKFGKSVKIISQADMSSNSSDVVANIDGHEVQIEVKGRQNEARWNSVFDLRIDSKGSNDLKKLQQINKVVEILTHERYSTIHQYVAAMRKRDSTYGWAGSKNAPNSGKVKLEGTTDVISKIIPIVRSHWKSKDEDYVATVLDGAIMYYRISGVNIIPGAKSTLPIKAVMVDTMGAGGMNVTRGSLQTRVCLKIKM